MRVSSVLAYWTCKHMVMGSNPFQFNLFFACTAILLYVIHCVFFQKSVIVHHCMTRLQVALVLTTSHKFVLLPCWYYRMYEVKTYDFRLDRTGVTAVPNSIQIRRAVLELNPACKERIKCVLWRDERSIIYLIQNCWNCAWMDMGRYQSILVLSQ
jgi:hypothetical protein